MYKRYELLHDYLLTADGNVIELDTLEQVMLIHDPVIKSKLNYKLLTDEKVWLDSKQTYTRLWRRFTVDEVVKMYNSPKATPYDIEVDATINATVENDATDFVANGVKVDENATLIPDEFKRPYVIVAGVAYKNSRAAARATGEHHTTIYRKCKLNKDGYFLVE